MQEFIHILLLKVELGPYSERRVRESLAAGHLLLTDLARYEPNKEWAPLEEVLANLPQPIVIAPPVQEPTAQPMTVEAAVVFITPAPPIAEAPPIPNHPPSPDTIEPAVVLVAPAPPVTEEPSAIIEAPPVAEFTPGALQPIVLLHSPLLPARQLLPPTKGEVVVTKAATGPTPSETLTPPSPDPAPQLLSTEKESVDVASPQDEAPVLPSQTDSHKKREITPPPEPVVPYNQPVPRPGPAIIDHWHAWGKYVATGLALFFLYCLWDWSTIGAAIGRVWANLNLFLIDIVDNVVAFFTPRPPP